MILATNSVYKVTEFEYHEIYTLTWNFYNFSGIPYLFILVPFLSNTDLNCLLHLFLMIIC